MSAARVGPLGVLSATGAMLVRNAAGDVDEVAIGADGNVLTVVAGVPAWAAAVDQSPASLVCDPTTALYKDVDPGGGAVTAALASTRGTHATIDLITAVDRGVVWQDYLSLLYAAAADLAVHIFWCPIDAVAGNVTWGASLERDNAGHDLDVDAFGAVPTLVTTASPAVIGQLAETIITLTGAALDGLVAGDPLRLFVERNGANILDTYANTVQIARVVVEEA